MLGRLIKVIASIITINGTAAAATVAYTNPNRLVKIDGALEQKSVELVTKLLDFSRNADEPVDILINSVGGDIDVGLRFISAIKTLQATGIVVRCYVPEVAYSAAFYILAACNKRYATRYARLMWHPTKMHVPDGWYSQYDLFGFYADLSFGDSIIHQQVINALKIPAAKYYSHYVAETMWIAGALDKLSPSFLIVVDGIE